jgi:murein DD-endopeptidase MepM/ murein hydrolase activator NlpD
MADTILNSVNALAPSLAAAGAPASATGATDPAKVKDLASQFEGLLLSKMMQDLKLSLGGEDDNPDSGNDIGPLGDVMTSELGLALSRAGGFGLGKALSGALLKQLPHGQSSADDTVAGLAAGTDLPIAGGTTGTPTVQTMPAPAPAAATASAPAPAAARVSSGFGWRSDPINGETKFHKGLDLALAQGTPVYAPADGRVESVGQQTGYGLTVVVRHANGFETRYAHLSAANVRAGDTITTGEAIAHTGNTGRSTGAHLHLEVLQNSQPVDPTGWVNAVVAPAPAPATGTR